MSMTRADHISTDAEYSEDGKSVRISHESFRYLLRRVDKLEDLLKCSYGYVAACEHEGPTQKLLLEINEALEDPS